VKRFVFTLEQVLRLKRQREGLAEMLLARAHADVRLARDRAADLRGQLDRVADGLAAAVGRPVVPADWAARADRAAHVGRAVEAADRAVVDALGRVDEAARRRAALAVEVEALKTLRHGQWERYRQDARRAEQERLDELSLGRWRPPENRPAE
jgi:flagellar export protein FliJ